MPLPRSPRHLYTATAASANLLRLRSPSRLSAAILVCARGGYQSAPIAAPKKGKVQQVVSDGRALLVLENGCPSQVGWRARRPADTARFSSAVSQSCVEAAATPIHYLNGSLSPFRLLPSGLHLHAYSRLASAARPALCAICLSISRIYLVECFSEVRYIQKRQGNGCRKEQRSKWRALNTALQHQQQPKVDSASV